MPTKTKPKFLTNALIRRARRRYDTHPVLEQHGSWAVTTYGLECLLHPYWIEWNRVNDEDWEEHLSAKGWVWPLDFRDALRSARRRLAAGLVPDEWLANCT